MEDEASRDSRGSRAKHDARWEAKAEEIKTKYNKLRHQQLDNGLDPLLLRPSFVLAKDKIESKTLIKAPYNSPWIRDETAAKTPEKKEKKKKKKKNSPENSPPGVYEWCRAILTDLGPLAPKRGAEDEEYVRLKARLAVLPPTPTLLWKRYRRDGQNPELLTPKRLWGTYLPFLLQERRSIKRIRGLMKRRLKRHRFSQNREVRKKAEMMGATPLVELEKELRPHEARKLANQRARRLLLGRKRLYTDALHSLSKLRRRSDEPSPDPSSPTWRPSDNMDMQAWLERAGLSMSALEQLRCIHVGGTMGKSTTAYVCAHLLESSQQLLPSSVGLFTSPHMLSVRECIRIGGKAISREEFGEVFSRLWQRFTRRQKTEGTDETGETKETKESADGLSEKKMGADSLDNLGPKFPSYHQFMTILAFTIFLENKVQCAVIESATGGAGDATNVLPPKAIAASIITSAAPVHGPSLKSPLAQSELQRAAASHVAGILAPGVPAFTMVDASENPEGWKVLARQADAIGASITNVVGNGADEIINALLRESAPTLTKDKKKKLEWNPDEDPFPAGVDTSILDGLPQARGALLAVHAVQARLGIKLLEEGLTDFPDWAMLSLRSRPRLLARWNQLRSPRYETAWFVDGAHTLESARQVKTWFDFNVARMDSRPSWELPSRSKILIFHHDGNVDHTLAMMRVLCERAPAGEAWKYPWPDPRSISRVHAEGDMSVLPFSHIFFTTTAHTGLEDGTSFGEDTFADDANHANDANDGLVGVNTSANDALVTATKRHLLVDGHDQHGREVDVRCFDSLSGATVEAMAEVIKNKPTKPGLRLEQEDRLLLHPWPPAGHNYSDKMHAFETSRLLRLYRVQGPFHLRTAVLVTGSDAIAAAMCRRVVGEELYEEQLW